MEALIFLLFLLTFGACEGDRHGLRYYEDLYVKPLADGIIVNHFTFTTQWDVSPEVLGHSANSGMLKLAHLKSAQGDILVYSADNVNI